MKSKRNCNDFLLFMSQQHLSSRSKACKNLKRIHFCSFREPEVFFLDCIAKKEKVHEEARLTWFKAQTLEQMDKKVKKQLTKNI